MAESDDNIVAVPSKLAYLVGSALLGGFVTLGGYMVQWNRDDLAFKREIVARIIALERDVQAGVLPRAEERLKGLDSRVRRLEDRPR